jgi:hypothetical protein
MCPPLVVENLAEPLGPPARSLVETEHPELVSNIYEKSTISNAVSDDNSIVYNESSRGRTIRPSLRVREAAEADKLLDENGSEPPATEGAFISSTGARPSATRAQTSTAPQLATLQEEEDPEDPGGEGREVTESVRCCKAFVMEACSKSSVQIRT